MPSYNGSKAEQQQKKKKKKTIKNVNGLFFATLENVSSDICVKWRLWSACASAVWLESSPDVLWIVRDPIWFLPEDSKHWSVCAVWSWY